MGVRNALTFIGAVVGGMYGQPQLGAIVGEARQLSPQDQPLVMEDGFEPR